MGSLESIAKQELQQYNHQFRAENRSNVKTEYDLKYHRLYFEVNPNMNYILGNVMSYFEPKESDFRNIDFDISSYLIIDSVKFHNQKCSYTHRSDLLTIELGMDVESLDSITVYYKGSPSSIYEGFGSFRIDEHEGKAVLWTLSQPYGARDWWPCKQSLNDKIDSIDVIVQVPYGNKVASNGLLVAEDHLGEYSVYHWKHRYPIVTYLIAIAVTNYKVYHDSVQLQNQQLDLVNYIYPEDLEKFKGGIDQTKNFLEIFDSVFIPYPFAEEKYGHAQFSRGGGMEHQTMSFMGSFGFDLVAHELAHQWFGDHITCGTWEDLWLNEGFATYATGICFEKVFPKQWWPVWKRVYKEEIMEEPDGSVFVSDTTDNDRLFDHRLTYAKGAFVLHTLRWVIGDSAFFTGVRNYLKDSSLAYQFAKTDHFKRHMEVSSRSDLQYFFDQWIYGEGYPVYNIFWQQEDAKTLQLLIQQETTHESVPFFDLPLEIQFKNAEYDTIISIRPSTQSETFTFELNQSIDSLFFDPNQWLIAKDSVHPKLLNIEEVLIYPNPSNSTVTIDISKFDYPVKELIIYDLGGLVVFKESYKNVEPQDQMIDLSPLSNGLYLIEVVSSEKVEIFRVLKE